MGEKKECTIQLYMLDASAVLLRPIELLLNALACQLVCHSGTDVISQKNNFVAISNSIFVETRNSVTPLHFLSIILA